MCHNARMETLLGAVVGGLLALGGTMLVLRAEQKHRMRERLLVELIPAVLHQLRAAQSGHHHLDETERADLRDASSRLVATLALGSSTDRRAARELRVALPDYEPATIDETAKWSEVPDVAARRIMYPHWELQTAEAVITSTRDRYVDELVHSRWEHVRKRMHPTEWCRSTRPPR